MAAANGFTSTNPDTRWGDQAAETGSMAAQLFTTPSGGEVNIARMGVYLYAQAASKNVRFAIFTHDAANNCPETMVASSESSSVSLSTLSAWTHYYFDYSTKPTLSASTSYWLIAWTDDTAMIFSYAVGSGLTALTGSPSGPFSWPTGAAWHSAYTPRTTYDMSVYAVYEAVTPTVEYLRLLTHSSAAGATGVEGWVIGSDNTTYYGYFSGKSFEAALDSGQAELLVPTADISPDGATLTTSDTPQVVVRNSTFGTTLCDATVVDE